MEEHSTFVGMDVHAETISVCLLAAGREGEERSAGTIANAKHALARPIGKLNKRGGKAQFCYEAGPCGYGVHRQIVEAGRDCMVVAPALIPRTPGERIKTDKRAARKLARLLRAGELTAVWVPDVAHEAMRDPVRARHAALRRRVPALGSITPPTPVIQLGGESLCHRP